MILTEGSSDFRAVISLKLWLDRASMSTPPLLDLSGLFMYLMNTLYPKS